MAAGLLAAGGVFMLVFLIIFSLAAVWILDVVLSLWVSALIVSGILLLIGGILAGAGAGILEEARSQAPPDDRHPSAEHQLGKGAVEAMSEIPERIEREMFEIRSRMGPDVRDLKKHAEPQVIVKRTSTKVRERVRDALTALGRA